MLVRLDKLLFIIIILIPSFLYAKENVLFTINNNPVTSIDLNQRLNYLSLLSSDFNSNNIDKKYYLEDIISVKLFDEFAKKKKFVIKEEEINDIFNKIINRLNNQNSSIYNELKNNNKITNDVVLKNIRFDLQRQKIIEIILRERINEINLIRENYDLVNIFDINFNYYIISNIYRHQLNEIKDEILTIRFNLIKETLNNHKIEYNYFSNNLIKFDQIDEQIKENIFKNNNKFLLDKDDYFLIGSISKTLKKDINLRYSFFQIIAKNDNILDDFDNEYLNCNNIKEIESNNNLEVIEYKSIQIERLNFDIFKNLSKENDKLMIKNNNQNLLILLCNIEYNKELVENDLYEKNIQKLASEIETEFIKTKKKEFNFKLFNN